MYSMDDLILINQLNEMASTGTGLPEMRSASNVDQLLQTKPLFRSNPATPQIFSAGMPGLTSMPDGPSGQVAGYASRATRGIPSNVKDLSRVIDPSGLMAGTAKDTSWLAKRVGLNPATATKVGRFAGRAVPVLSAIANVQDAANIVTGEESLGNKAMDLLAGTGGAIAGFITGGPLGASVGFSTGKALSDGAQWLFGDKKTPEQRKMELALQQLQGGRMV